MSVPCCTFAPVKSNVNNEVRERLLEQAQQMFMKQGVKNLTMDEIAKTMGISKKTIYVQVKDKSELVLETIKRYVNNEKTITTQIRNKTQNPIEEMVLLMNHILLQTKELNPLVLLDIEKYYPASWKIYKHYRNHYIFDFIHTNVKEGIAKNYYRDDLKSDVVTKFYIGALNMIIDQGLFPTSRYTFVSVLKEYTQYHLRAIVTSKGLKELLHYQNNSN